MEKNPSKIQSGKPQVTGDATRETADLRKELARSRRRAANLEAAMNAALSAQEFGESDAFWYLRDEITYGHGDVYGA